jgi:phosphatidylglycerol:prolipoprotein diacylglycerol transferase
MQYPIDLMIGGVRIPSHFIFDALSLLLGYRYYAYLRDRADFLDKNTRLSVTLAALGGAVIGAKFLAFGDSFGTALQTQLGLAYIIFGGKTIVGALIGGILGAEAGKWLIKERSATGDIFTFPLIYGMIIGRLGCFLTGVSDDTVGLPSNLPWAMDQGDGILRHPTALYEIIFLGILWIALAKFRPRANLAQGVLFRLFITSYLFFRVAIDFLKPGQPLLLGMTAIQLAALIFALWYAFDIARKQRTHAPKKYATSASAAHG